MTSHIGAIFSQTNFKIKLKIHFLSCTSYISKVFFSHMWLVDAALGSTDMYIFIFTGNSIEQY